ncbi:NAD(P)-dependent oxidoreductase [Egibacter rhizosphaerae]|uniref:NAD(P)-dependent oxidoreductase n=1 Tax=Egibacter rhizosphaerae TaxID=1670831 RepID=A0A411YHU7_9ACTN|nr:NAD(P)-dependent oxidoreductase [Egibacter rhizosphaerae]QBI20905.1 NAD(P)-dependent oxidoreductase [Egibacter rhizosphaerae]
MGETDRAAPTVGWMGTGRMGALLVERLLAAGFDVAVWNRTREKAEPLAAQGAKVVDRPVELAGRDVVCSMLADSAAFESAMTGDGGLLTDPDRAPEVVCDSSTIAIAAAERVKAAVADRPVEVLAAPVSGSPKVVAAGRLGVVVSGDPSAFERAEPVLAEYGQSVTYVGDAEQARLAKICHNLLLGVISQSMAEITVLAERGGMSRHEFLAFINSSALGSMFTRYKTPQLVNLDWAPTFTSHLLRKDLELGLDAAREADVPMPLVSETHQLLLRLIGEGHGDSDFAALLELAARGAGMELEPENVEVSDGLRDNDAEGEQ